MRNAIYAGIMGAVLLEPAAKAHETIWYVEPEWPESPEKFISRLRSDNLAPPARCARGTEYEDMLAFLDGRAYYVAAWYPTPPSGVVFLVVRQDGSGWTVMHYLPRIEGTPGVKALNLKPLKPVKKTWCIIAGGGHEPMLTFPRALSK